MPFVPAPNTLRVSFEHLLDLQEVVNVLWFVREVAWTIFDVTDAVLALRDAWDNNIMPNMSSSLTFTQVVARDYSSQFGVAASAASGGVGSISGECAPSNVSFAVHFGTGQVGRSRRGRAFVCGVPNSEVSQNTIETAWAAQLVAGFAGVADDVFAATGAGQCIASFQEGGIALTTANTWLVTEYTTVDLIADSQRRRLPGRGA